MSSGKTLLQYTPNDTLKFTLRKHLTQRPHYDMVIGRVREKNGKFIPIDDVCPDFYTTSKEARTLNGLSQKKKEYVRGGNLHSCSFVTMPIGVGGEIPYGEYGAGKWKIEANGNVFRNEGKASFKLEFLNPSGIECKMYSPFEDKTTWILSCKSNKEIKTPKKKGMFDKLPLNE